MNAPRLRVALLLVLALAQMAGDVLQVPALRALAAATGASPAPRVFSAVRGFETYSTRFELAWPGPDGAEQHLELTPEVAARLVGPYNRRNVYGAALAYGPVLASDPRTAPMLRAVLSRALCGPAPLLLELGVPPASIAGPMTLRYTPLPGTDMGALPSILEVECP